MEKHILAPFCNVAISNCIRIINSLSLKYNIDPYTQSDTPSNASLTSRIQEKTLDSTLKAAVLENLNHHFPALSFISLNRDSALFEGALLLLENIRNQHCHYKRQNDLDGSFLEKPLSDPALKQHEKVLKHIENLSKKASENIIWLFNGSLDETNKTSIEEIPKKHSFLFVVTLFLTKRQSELLLSKITGFRNTNTDYFKATRACFTQFCVKLPKDKLHSQNPQERLVLNALEYLRKCPDEVYQITSQGNRRYEDRFGYFALALMDQAKVFPRLRFHLCLGKKTNRIWHSTSIGTNTLPKRSQVRNVLVFDRLQHHTAENCAWIQVKDHLEPEDLLPFEIIDPNLVQYAPHYHIKHNRIGIRFQDEDLTDLPTLTKEGYKTFLESHHTEAFLSMHELRNLAFFLLLSNKEGGAVEGVLTQKIKNYRSLFEDIATDKVNPSSNSDLNALLDQYKIDPVVVPDSIRNHWKEEEGSQEKQIITKIEFWKSVTQEKWEKVKNKEHKKRTYPRIGDITTFLAKDINFFFDSPEEENSLKLSALEFTDFQSCLALGHFSIGYFQALRLFQRNHPFLPESFKNEKLLKNPFALKELYRDYLGAKINWLKKAQKYPEAFARYFKFRDVSSGISNLSNSLAQLPIHLPRNLFKTQIMGKCENNTSISTCIAECFSETQSFYKTSRTYTISGQSFNQDKLLEAKKRFPNLRKEIKHALDTEQKIRYHQNCDRILFQLIRMLLDLGDPAIEIQNISGLSTLENICCNFSIWIYGLSIKFEAIALQNLKEVKALIFDRRLISIAPYFTQNDILEVNYAEINEWFDQMEQVWPNLVEQILGLEEKIYALDRLYFDSLLKGQSHIPFKCYSAFLERGNKITSEEKIVLNCLRNAVMHFEFPTYDVLNNHYDNLTLKLLFEEILCPETEKETAQKPFLQLIYLSL